MMGLTQDRLGQEYGNGQSAMQKPLGLGDPVEEAKNVNANDEQFALAA